MLKVVSAIGKTEQSKEHQLLRREFIIVTKISR